MIHTYTFLVSEFFYNTLLDLLLIKISATFVTKRQSESWKKLKERELNSS